jgi:serine/threonine protein kinase
LFAISATDPPAAREVGYLLTLKGLYGFPQLIDGFEYEGENYIVMHRLLRSLRTILKDSNRLPLSKAGAIRLQLIDRMQTLHGLGIVHKDLYPFNMNLGMKKIGSNFF